MKLEVRNHCPPREPEFQGRKTGEEKQLKSRNVRSPRSHPSQSKLDCKESADRNWKGPSVPKLALFHCEHLPKGERIACAKFKEAVSEWLRLSANVFLEVPKTETPARAVLGNKLSGVYRR